MQVPYVKFVFLLISSWTLWVFFVPSVEHVPPTSFGTVGISTFKQCLGKAEGLPSQSNGYLMAMANGGLNQMRTGICDMVAIAKLMNATLVIPALDHDSYWKDPSTFEDLFDVEHFIKTLSQDVTIVKELPPAYRCLPPVVMTPKSWSDADYYKQEVLPLLLEKGLVQFTKTNSRLVNNFLPDNIQKLRCRANFKALKLQERIQRLANIIVQRMRVRAEKDLGRYMALHLRYEKDMLAFTGCTHGLGDEEAAATALLRNQTDHWRVKDINSDARRREGKCPMTPREVALFLKALGFPSSTQLYLVAGHLFGKESWASLTEEYSNIVTHEELCSSEELAPFVKYQNQLAAVDSLVALESDVFVYSYSGNMARFVEGQRRFAGHRMTISPDTARMVELVDSLDAGQISWSEFELRVRKLHSHRTGAPSLRKPGDDRKTEENFYANPVPECICSSSSN